MADGDVSFVLVEGINLYDNIYDTSQLSIIRGSSFLYKDAIDSIQDEYKKHLDTISTGASSGLFRICSPDNTNVVAEIESYLAQEANYKHLTFAVVECKASSLQQAKQRLYTKLRFKQLQTLTIKPDLLDDSIKAKPCGLSGSRITSRIKRQIQSNEAIPVAYSVNDRLEYGRDKKQSYYISLIDRNGTNKDETDKDKAELKQKLETYKFAPNIEALCSIETNNKTIQPLSGKMAVIYLDGNRFGSCQEAYLKEHGGSNLEESIEAQTKFDNLIQDQRAKFLTKYLKQQCDNETQTDFIRLETLLWGGDELLVVLPAWSGFDFLKQFFEFPWSLNNESLTHAGGIVFCQANTPIRIVQNLARELAELQKEKEGGRDNNSWDYLVLESVDYPTNESIADYFTERYGEPLIQIRNNLPFLSTLPIDLATLDPLLKERALSRSQLHHIVRTVHQMGSQPSMTKWDDLLTAESNDKTTTEPTYTPQEIAERRSYAVSEQPDFIKDKLPELAKQLFQLNIDNANERAWFWLHLMELWDYLLPLTDTAQEAKK